MQELPGRRDGRWCSTGRDVALAVVEAVRKQRGDRLALAGQNAPDQTVISGERGAVLEACERLTAAHGIANRGLSTSPTPSHSPLMRPSSTGSGRFARR